MILSKTDLDALRNRIRGANAPLVDDLLDTIAAMQDAQNAIDGLRDLASDRLCHFALYFSPRDQGWKIDYWKAVLPAFETPGEAVAAAKGKNKSTNSP